MCTHFDHNSHSHHYYSPEEMARAVHQIVSCVRSGLRVVPFGPDGLSYSTDDFWEKWKVEIGTKMSCL